MTNGLKLQDKPSHEKEFEKYYRQYYHALYQKGYKYLKDKKLVEDALQEVFIKMWNKREELGQIESIEAFLFTSMKNQVLNSIRNHKREILKQVAKQNEEREHVNDTEETILLNECSQRVQEGLEKLSPRKRMIFQQKIFQGKSNEEIASNFQISINTVKVQFTQASKFMKSYIGG